MSGTVVVRFELVEVDDAVLAVAAVAADSVARIRR